MSSPQIPQIIFHPSLAPLGQVTAAAATEPGGDARQQEFQRALAGQLGRQMPAQVLSKLGDGSFLVKVAGATARMQLPSNPQPGAALTLTLVSLEPRATFQLDGSALAAPFQAFAQSQPAIANAALYAAASAGLDSATMAMAADAHTDDDAASSHATLSEAARVIGSVLLAASRATSPQTAIVAALPLLAQAPTDPVILAAALKHAIAASGLFYESHVAEWSSGTRALADLAREPQMQQAGSAPARAADPDTAQFINLQLTTQEQGRVTWQGQPWPGQDLAWQISRDAPERDARGDDGTAPAPAWRSALQLRFAVLGELKAQVVVAGGQVHISLQADSDSAAALLRAGAGALHSALEAAGSPLAALRVGTDDPGHD